MERMDFNTFKSWAAENIIAHMPSEYEGAKVQVHKVDKPGAPYTGLMVIKKGQTVVPNVNLEMMYEMYSDGAPAKKIMEDMAEIAAMEPPVPIKPAFYLDDYEAVKDRICLRLINLEANAELLKNVPHRVIEDMALTYIVVMDTGGDDLWSSMVTNEIAAEWGASEDGLCSDALKNSAILFPPRLDTMNSLMGKEPEEGGEPGLMVLSCKGGFFGACAILYPGVLNMAYEEIGEDLYIIPSSVNEVILVPKALVDDPVRLLLTHRFVSSQTAPAERLSSRIFFYDHNTRRFKNAVPEAVS